MNSVGFWPVFGGVRRFVPDKFVFGVLDYYFAVGVWGFGVGVLRFWAWDEFWGRIVTDSFLDKKLGKNRIIIE